MAQNSLLVVDDDRSILAALKLLLEGSYAVCTAENASDALNLLHKQKPDLILIDIGLPDVSGMHLLAQIKEANDEAAVIMLTAVDNPETIAKALDLGAFGYLTKPISARELKTTLQDALDQQEPQKRVMKRS